MSDTNAVTTGTINSNHLVHYNAIELPTQSLCQKRLCCRDTSSCRRFNGKKPPDANICVNQHNRPYIAFIFSVCGFILIKNTYFNSFADVIVYVLSGVNSTSLLSSVITKPVLTNPIKNYPLHDL